MRGLDMRRLLLVVPLSMVFLVSCYSPKSVNQITSRHIKVMGGLQQQKAVQSILVVQRVDTGDATESFDFVTMRKREGKFRMEDPPVTPTNSKEQSDSETIEGCDGRISWSKVGTAPAKTVAGFCGDVTDIDSLLITYKEKGLSLKLIGRQKLASKDLYHLKLSGKATGSLHYYFDVHTFLLDRIISENHGSHHEDIYSDYRKVNGIMVPFSDEMRWWAVKDDPQLEDEAASSKIAGPEGKQKQLIQKIEINVPLDDSLFSLPQGVETGASSKN